MLSIGFLELALILLVSLITLVIPTAMLLVTVLLYRKLERIERLLSQRK